MEALAAVVQSPDTVDTDTRQQAPVRGDTNYRMLIAVARPGQLNNHPEISRNMLCVTISNRLSARRRDANMLDFFQLNVTNSSDYVPIMSITSRSPMRP